MRPPPFLFTDADALTWEVIDYVGGRGERKRINLGSWDAGGRAFVPVDRPGEPVLLCMFGHIAYHDTSARTLQSQLDGSCHAMATPRERMEARPPNQRVPRPRSGLAPA